jgi:hypothetical protein
VYVSPRYFVAVWKATTRRTWLMLGLTVVLVAAFTAGLLHFESLRREAAIDSAIQNGPLRISVIEGVTGRSLELHLDPPGNATLRTDSPVSGWDLPLPIVNVTVRLNAVPTRETHRFVVPQAQLDELRKALVREHFFDLDDSYGDNHLVDRRTTILVYAGDFKKAVELHFLAEDEPERLREPSRALRVLQIMFAWFDEPEMTYLRQWDQRLIDAAGRK